MKGRREEVLNLNVRIRLVGHISSASFSGKKHYNEFHAVKMARALMNESEDEDDNKSVEELGKVSDDPDVSDAGGATPEDGEGGEKSKGGVVGRGSGSNSPMDTEPTNEVF